MMNYYYGYPMSYGFNFFGFFSILWFILIVWLFVSILRRLFGHHDHHSVFETKDRALEILRRRYAKGKITKKEFDQMKKDLA